MRILPPLIVGEREIDEALAIMDKVAKEWPPQ
jgi:4-aminobutyrate aminotransferase-like enzyme